MQAAACTQQHRISITHVPYGSRLSCDNDKNDFNKRNFLVVMYTTQRFGRFLIPQTPFTFRHPPWARHRIVSVQVMQLGMLSEPQVSKCKQQLTNHVFWYICGVKLHWKFWDFYQTMRQQRRKNWHREYLFMPLKHTAIYTKAVAFRRSSISIHYL